MAAAGAAETGQVVVEKRADVTSFAKLGAGQGNRCWGTLHSQACCPYTWVTVRQRAKGRAAGSLSKCE